MNEVNNSNENKCECKNKDFFNSGCSCLSDNCYLCTDCKLCSQCCEDLLDWNRDHSSYYDKILLNVEKMDRFLEKTKNDLKNYNNK